MSFDVIVAGAGPAGSAAARELALRGRNVLVLERAKHPRRKVCGGCLSARIGELLGSRFHGVVERSVREVVFTYKSERFFYHKSPSVFAYLVQRERFDHHLAKEAAQAGARIHEEEPVTNVEESRNGVRVTTPKGRYEAAYLVGADGVVSIVARRLGLMGGRIMGLAREADIQLPLRRDPGKMGILTIAMGEVPFGYGWVFPKEDSVSVGVAGERDRIQDVKGAFSRFLARQSRLGEAGDIHPTGYFLASVTSRRSPISSARTLLVGDAAGFADPLLGEGIYYSVLSGIAAACAVDQALAGNGNLEPYKRHLKETIFEEFDAARFLAGMFHRLPRFAYYLLEEGDVIEGFCDVLRGTSTYREQLDNLKSLAPPEILRYLGVLRHASRAMRPTPKPSSFWAGHVQTAIKSLVTRFAADPLRELTRERLPGGAAVLNASNGDLGIGRLVREAANPSRLVHLALNPKGNGATSHPEWDPLTLQVSGDLLQLPFPDNCFDAVICVGEIEKLRKPHAAVQEFLRVIRPGGSVIYVFLALPHTRRGRLASYLLEHASDWPFLPSHEQPFHRCEVSQLMELAGGMVKIAALGKCCDVAEPLSRCDFSHGRSQPVGQGSNST